MTNDTIHDDGGDRKDMSIAAIKERRKARQSFIERVRGKPDQGQAGQEQTSKQRSEEDAS